jgi:hypothetical protein
MICIPNLIIFIDKTHFYINTVDPVYSERVGAEKPVHYNRVNNKRDRLYLKDFSYFCHYIQYYISFGLQNFEFDL